MQPIRRCRDATPGDIAELVRLEAQFPGDRMTPRQLRLHAGRDAGMRVIAEGAHLLGYSLVLFRLRSRVARLYSLVVDGAQRGRGLGAVLVADAETCARRRHVDELRLEVRADNSAALALYRSTGYREIGRRPRYYDDGMDAIRLAKVLAGNGGP